jgi:hypothetical protein
MSARAFAVDFERVRAQVRGDAEPANVFSLPKS